MNRRGFMQALACGVLAGLNFKAAAGKTADLYAASALRPAFGPAGRVSLFHLTDLHAQLLPVYFREPDHHVMPDPFKGRPPHLSGKRFLDYYLIRPGTALAHAFTHMDFNQAAARFGAMGGFAHLSTLLQSLRAERPHALLLDGGDNWQGSATALWTRGADMTGAALRLGVDVMTGHWEFTLGAERVMELVNGQLKNRLDFVAQNIVDADFEEAVFPPYVMKTLNGITIAVIGQAFPYTPIAHPAFLMPRWRFGIREESLQKHVDTVRRQGAQVVVLLSHNGMDVDLKLASRISGLDIILGGHTHDVVPKPVIVNHRGGKTVVVNGGCSGKFIGVMDLSVRGGKLRDYNYHLLPVFSHALAADPSMAGYIEEARRPYLNKLRQPLAKTDQLLYRRGTFNGSFDQLILNAMLETTGAQMAFSPGFRWGTNVLPGDTVYYEDVMAMTAISYPMVTLNELTGERIKLVLEDIADNVFNANPYFQQGGDMVRSGGLGYRINPAAGAGKRISHMVLNGQAVKSSKRYRVAGWASVAEFKDGMPVWDLVANYLRDKKTISRKDVTPVTPQVV